MAGRGFDIVTPRETAELEPFRRLIDQAMIMPVGPGPAADPPPPDRDWLMREGCPSIRLARRGGELIGGLSVQRFGQWFGGASVPTGGVRAVAVAPEHRGQGVTRQLMVHALGELRDAGIPLSSLYPATQRVYRRQGYELAGSRITYRLPLAALPVDRGAPAVVAASITDPAPLVEPYRRRAAAGNGQLDRNPWLWQRLLDPLLGVEGPSHAYVVPGETGIDGYIVFSQRRGADFLHTGEVVARDVVAHTAPALAALTGFVAGHRSMVESLTWTGAPADPLFVRTDNPAVRVTARLDWMLRLVDVPAALAARGYASAVRGEVELEVHDDVLPWNQGRWRLTVADGAASVRPGGEGRLRIDVRGLAALYTGYLAPAELVTLGYLAGGERDRATIGALFAGPAPWMPEMF